MSQRLYGFLIRLYPRRFRERWGEDLKREYRDRAAEARHAGVGRLRFCLLILIDLVRSVPAEHIHDWRRRAVGAMDRKEEGMVTARVQDLRYAFRTFRRAPGFTVACLATLALGIGATTTIFSVVDTVLLRSLPYPDAGRLVVVGQQFGSIQVNSLAPLDFFDLQRDVQSFEALAAARLQYLNLEGSGEPERLDGAGVSASYFDVLSVRPILGRGFRPEDDRPGTPPVVVLSHGLWQRRFGGDLSVLGRSMTLNDVPRTVIGIMPPDFRPPEAIHQGSTELWFPLGQIDDELDTRDNAFIAVIGRLRPGATLEAARADLEVMARRLDQEFPNDNARSYWVIGMRERTTGDVGVRLGVLLGAVGFLLLIACANVANLFLVRATERAREVAVRAALGAGRARLAGQLLTESILMAFTGGVIGVLLAWAGVRTFKALSPGDIPRLAEVAVDGRVLVFALAASFITGVLFGLAPVLQGLRGGLTQPLRDGGHGSTSGRPRHRLRSALVVTQTAVAVVLLVGAGLLINSFIRLSRVPPGFDPDNAVWLQVFLPRHYDSDEERNLFFHALLERVRAIPGVRSAGAIHGLPLDRNRSIRSFLLEGQTLEPGEEPPRVAWHSTTPGFFAAFGVPFAEGQDFSGTDRAGLPLVAIVNQTFVRTYWPSDVSAVGKRIWLSRETHATVVGVVGDIREQRLEDQLEPVLYVPLAQAARGQVTFVARHDGRDGTGVIRAIREAVWAADPSIPVDRFGTLRDHVSSSLVQPRFYTALLASFAAVALTLAFVGLYGTLAYTVRIRGREVGIRMALGAARRDVRRLVIGQGMRLATAGVGLGTFGALATARALRSFVFGVTHTDPTTFACMALAMLFFAFIASWIPARRAAATEPMRTLRSE